MNRARLQLWLKWLWVIAVTVAVLWYLQDRRETVLAAVSDFSLPVIAASLLLLLLAKLGLSENAFAAARAMRLPVTRLEVYRLYNFSQLGKYIPGSIWQYVSRGAGYRFAGASYTGITNTLLLETLWVLGGAGLVGVVLAGPALGRQVHAAGLVSAEHLLWAVLVAIGGLIVIVMLVTRFRHRLRPLGKSLLPGPRIILLQLVIWVLLGLSFAVLLPEAGADLSLAYIIGLFAIAYAVGFVAIFAPAGLGVREGMLVLGLGIAIPVEQAVVIVLVARVIYLLSELVIAGLMLIAGRFGNYS